MSSREDGVHLSRPGAILVSLAVLLIMFPPVQDGRSEEGDPSHRRGDDDRAMSNMVSNFSRYMDFYEVESYLKELASLHSDIMRLYSLGKTYEGRDVWCAKVSDQPDIVDDGGEQDEPDVLLVGAHHANEWMSYEVPLFVLTFLLENFGRETSNGSIAGSIVENREVFIIPILNPDGVQYAHEQSRGWRKNREPNYVGDFGPVSRPSPELRPISYGVDLNRNYGWMWGLRGGSSEFITSSGTYRGPPDNYDQDGDAIVQVDLFPGRLPFGPEEGVDEDPWDGIDNDRDGDIDEDPEGGFTSEETRMMKKLGDEHRFPVLITYHTYSELVLWPWGYTDELPRDHLVMSQFGERMAEMNGYRPMQGYELYQTTGEMTDWFYAQYGTLGYTFEIGTSHSMPEDRILEQCERNLEPTLYLCALSSNPYQSFLRFDDNSTELLVRSDRIDVKLSYEDEGYPYPFSSDRSRVVYRENGGGWKRVPLREQEDGNWTAVLPIEFEGSEVELYFELVDSQGRKVVEPLFSPNDPIVVTAGRVDSWSLLMGIDTVLIMLFTLGVTWGGFTFGITYSAMIDRRKGVAS